MKPAMIDLHTPSEHGVYALLAGQAVKTAKNAAFRGVYVPAVAKKQRCSGARAFRGLPLFRSFLYLLLFIYPPGADDGVTEGVSV